MSGRLEVKTEETELLEEQIQGKPQQRTMKGLCYGLLGGLPGLLNAVFEKEHPDAGTSSDYCLQQGERALCPAYLGLLVDKAGKGCDRHCRCPWLCSNIADAVL